MAKVKNFKFVWPKDGPKGRSGHRGFFGRLDNVLTGRGPDIFIQRKGSSTPIKPDHWGNWDSYHSFGRYMDEERGGYQNGLWTSSRGFKRYDPHTRRYRHWVTPHDWFGEGVNGYGVGPNGVGYPRFTRSEGKRMNRRIAQGRRINPASMGPEWHRDGPRRFQQEYDYFWQEAHRRGENRREGFYPLAGTNPNFRMHQEFPQDLPDWIRSEMLWI